MQLGDATLGNTTIGFSSTQTDISVSATATSTLTPSATAGYNLTFAGSSTSTSVLYKAVNLSYTSVAAGTTTLNISKGRPVSIQPVSQTVGETSLGETTLGLVDQNARVISNLFSTVNKGRTVAFDSSVDSTLRINRRIDLTLTALAQSSSDWVVTKGIEVRFDSQTDTTLVLVPDFDEIIGKSRADGTQQQIVRSNGERIFILEAEGQID
jgi:hypothetical protein